MPIYEYKCENGHVFDIMQKMADDPLSECVECGASVRKILQPVGISFKGSGFYSTDYSGKSKAEAAAKTDAATKPESTSKNGDSKNGSENNSSKESKKSESSSSAPSSNSSSTSSSSKKD